jgi:hypothetical protein
VLHGLEADIKAGASTITDPQFLEDGRVKKFSLVDRLLVRVPPWFRCGVGHAGL